eukprot:1211782-Prorocentrum_lima.AAC.1
MFAVLDLGCTRSMASQTAIGTSETTAWESGAWLEWKPCNAMIKKNTTVVDVHEANDVPILISLPRMMKLGF